MLADSQNAVRGQSVSVKSTLRFDTGVYTANGQLTVERTGSEEVQINVDSVCQGKVGPPGLIQPGWAFTNEMTFPNHSGIFENQDLINWQFWNNEICEHLMGSYDSV